MVSSGKFDRVASPDLTVIHLGRACCSRWEAPGTTLESRLTSTPHPLRRTMERMLVDRGSAVAIHRLGEAPRPRHRRDRATEGPAAVLPERPEGSSGGDVVRSRFIVPGRIGFIST